MKRLQRLERLERHEETAGTEETVLFIRINVALLPPVSQVKNQ